jgi:type IV pilus assembly protein PilV
MRLQLNRGFTLIEVLVTLVILTFGLLGIAGLMAKGQRVSYEAFQRHQALQIANEMAERLRANKLQAAAYAAAAPSPTGVGAGSQFASLAAGTCGTAACTAPQLAAYDVALWDGQLQGYGELSGATRTGGVVNARGCIEAVAANTIASAFRGKATTTPAYRRARGRVRVAPGFMAARDSGAWYRSMCCVLGCHADEGHDNERDSFESSDKPTEGDIADAPVRAVADRADGRVDHWFAVDRRARRHDWRHLAQLCDPGRLRAHAGKRLDGAQSDRR